MHVYDIKAANSYTNLPNRSDALYCYRLIMVQGDIVCMCLCVENPKI